jgi:hypothetical protein
MAGFNNALFNFQLATVAIGDGDYSRAYKLLDGALRYIDRNGRDANVRDDIFRLREAVSLKLTSRLDHPA